MMNGMMVCCCNLTMGMCKCEMTKDGVCITCTSGDQVLRDDPGLLRLHGLHAQGRLHLLRDDEQHARLLRLLLIRQSRPDSNYLETFSRPWL